MYDWASLYEGRSQPKGGALFRPPNRYSAFLDIKNARFAIACDPSSSEGADSTGTRPSGSGSGRIRPLLRVEGSSWFSYSSVMAHSSISLGGSKVVQTFPDGLRDGPGGLVKTSSSTHACMIAASSSPNSMTDQSWPNNVHPKIYGTALRERTYSIMGYASCKTLWTEAQENR